MFATGNHDMEAAYPTHGYGGHLARWISRQRARAVPSVYSFVYGNVAVLSLDANDVITRSPEHGYSGGSQNHWVEKTLAAHRANPTSTSSSASSTTAPTRPPSNTPATAACARPGPTCSIGTRSTWCCRATTTSSNAPTDPRRPAHNDRRRQRVVYPNRRHRLLHRRIRGRHDTSFSRRAGKLSRQCTSGHLRAQQLL